MREAVNPSLAGAIPAHLCLEDALLHAKVGFMPCPLRRGSLQ